MCFALDTVRFVGSDGGHDQMLGLEESQIPQLESRNVPLNQVVSALGSPRFNVTTYYCKLARKVRSESTFASLTISRKRKHRMGKLEE